MNTNKVSKPRTSRTWIAFYLLLCIAAGCNSKDYDFQSRQFDQQIIERLPIYDSLSHLFIRNFARLQEEINEKNSLLYERPVSNSFRSNSLPPDTVAKINAYINQLGENFIRHIFVYGDSTIRYDVRDTYLEPYFLTIRDKLSYLPNGGDWRPGTPPDRDTLLNKNWLYRLQFDEQRLF